MPCYFIMKCQCFFFFLLFAKKNTFAKNLVLELWSKNLRTNQNAGFFKLQYLTKNV